MEKLYSTRQKTPSLRYSEFRCDSSLHKIVAVYKGMEMKVCEEV